jgi:hypothetical protein
MRRLFVPIAAALLGAGAALGACAPVESQSKSAATQTVAQAMCALGHSAIPLRTLPTGHHLADVTVNGKAGKFIVDTGAGRTVVHQPYVDLFELRAGGPRGTAIGAGGATAISQVGVASFQIASTRTALDHLFAMDLSHAVRALDPIVGSPVHGIVGQDVMQAQHAIIDVRQERLYLKPLQGEPQTGC